MKLVLISPYPDFRSYGLRSISTFLRGRGAAVTTVYLMHPYNTPYRKKVLEQLLPVIADSDLIGISVMSNYLMNAVQITEAIKKRLEVPVAWGGVHPTVLPEECLEYCDVAVIGEGEQTAWEILQSIKNGAPAFNIKGTAVKLHGRTQINDLRPLMKAEDLPLIDNDFSADYALFKDDRLRKIDSDNLKWCVTRDYMTLSSLGCPFSCSYCINNRLNKMFSGKVRFRKIDDVINELVLAKKKMPFLKQVTFDDDAFISRDVAELEELARRYRQSIGLPFFISGVNPRYLSEEKIGILVEAGLNRIKMGIQSGSTLSKSLYHRNISNDRIVSSARIINKYQKKLALTAYDLILDNPFETNEDIIQTIQLLTRLPAPFTLNLSSLTFYPGTDIHEKAVAAGYVKDNLRDVYQKLYHGVSNSYLNWVILLFAIFKVPGFLLKILLNERIVRKQVRVPRPIFHFFILAGFLRRALDFLIKGDPHTLYRLVRYNPLKP